MAVWPEGFRGGRIIHAGKLGFRSVALKKITGSFAGVWVRGSMDGIIWPDDGPLAPILIAIVDTAGTGMFININQLQDGRADLFIDNGDIFLKHSVNGTDWGDF